MIIGLIDDCISLTPQQKIVGQLIATICFVKGGLYLKATFLLSSSNPLFYAFWLVVSALWTLSIINAFNLVDVMDGLAASLALMGAFSFLVISLLTKTYSVALFLSAFVGARWVFVDNRPPARIYLGDAGSLFIGGVLGAVPFMIPWGTFSWYGYLAPVIILGIPLLEVGTLIIIRTSFDRNPVFYAGTPHHFSHFLRARGWRTPQILMYTALCSLLLLLSVALVYLFALLGLFG